MNTVHRRLIEFPFVHAPPSFPGLEHSVSASRSLDSRFLRRLAVILADQPCVTHRLQRRPSSDVQRLQRVGEIYRSERVGLVSPMSRRVKSSYNGLGIYTIALWSVDLSE